MSLDNVSCVILPIEMSFRLYETHLVLFHLHAKCLYLTINMCIKWSSLCAGNNQTDQFDYCYLFDLFCILWRHALHLKSFIAKRVISILVNLRSLRFKLLKYKENNKKICNTCDHNFKNIPLYIMRKVSLERYYFVLYDGALTLKMSKMSLGPFCDETLHLYCCQIASILLMFQW